MADLMLQLAAAAQGTEAYGDLALSDSGDLIVNTSQDAVRQAVELRLRAASGDWFMDTSAGLPYSQFFKSGQYDPMMDSLIKNQILATPGVLGLLSWNVSVSRATKVVTIAFEAETDTGTIVFSLPIGATA